MIYNIKAAGVTLFFLVNLGITAVNAAEYIPDSFDSDESSDSNDGLYSSSDFSCPSNPGNPEDCSPTMSDISSNITPESDLSIAEMIQKSASEIYSEALVAITAKHTTEVIRLNQILSAADDATIETVDALIELSIAEEKAKLASKIYNNLKETSVGLENAAERQQTVAQAKEGVFAAVFTARAERVRAERIQNALAAKRAGVMGGNIGNPLEIKGEAMLAAEAIGLRAGTSGAAKIATLAARAETKEADRIILAKIKSLQVAKGLIGGEAELEKKSRVIAVASSPERAEARAERAAVRAIVLTQKFRANVQLPLSPIEEEPEEIVAENLLASAARTNAAIMIELGKEEARIKGNQEERQHDLLISDLHDPDPLFED